MSEGVWIALIAGVPTTLATIGAGLAGLVKIVQGQSKATIEAKDAQIAALNASIALKDDQIAERDGRIAELLAQLASGRSGQGVQP